MSLWTPGGEHEVPRNPPPSRPTGSEPASTDRAPSPAIEGPTVPLGMDPSLLEALDELSPEQRAEAEQMLAEMTAAQERIASVPAADMIINHLGGIYELAAIHLNQDPPHFPEAALAIEALRAVLDRLEGRLGDAEASLREALRQIQVAFVQLKERAAPGDARHDEG